MKADGDADEDAPAEVSAATDRVDTVGAGVGLCGPIFSAVNAGIVSIERW